MKAKFVALTATAVLALSAFGSLPAIADSATLSEGERADLTRNRDEERLARDLYTAFASKYPDTCVFARIAASEQRHFDSVGAALVRYQVADPSAGQGVGTYAGDLSATYDTLLARGSASLDAALAVGAEFEEFDIAELASAAETTDNPDLDRLYANLKRASEQHLAGVPGVMPNPDTTCDQSGANRPDWAGTGAGQQGQARRDAQKANPRRSAGQGRQGSNRPTWAGRGTCDGGADCQQQGGARRGR